MENFIPILTDINQVFSFETLQQLSVASFNLAKSIDWGNDRVVSLTGKDTPVKKQWNGTCTSFAVTAAIENIMGGNIHLSERSLWDSYGVFSTEEAINAAKIHWIMEEKYWPQHEMHLDAHSKNKGRYKLLVCNYLERDYLRVLRAIDEGKPCVVALSTPQDLYSGKPQVEANSEIMRKSGHAICVSGYKVENGNCYFLVKNSWGIDCGNEGYQYVAFDLFDKRNAYAIFWEIKEVTDRGEQMYTLTQVPEALLEASEHI